jgi:hypothetical protein
MWRHRQRDAYAARTTHSEREVETQGPPSVAGGQGKSSEPGANRHDPPTYLAAPLGFIRVVDDLPHQMRRRQPFVADFISAAVMPSNTPLISTGPTPGGPRANRLSSTSCPPLCRTYERRQIRGTQPLPAICRTQVYLCLNNITSRPPYSAAPLVLILGPAATHTPTHGLHRASWLRPRGPHTLLA